MGLHNLLEVTLSLKKKTPALYFGEATSQNITLQVALPAPCHLILRMVLGVSHFID